MQCHNYEHGIAFKWWVWSVVKQVCTSFTWNLHTNFPMLFLVQLFDFEDEGYIVFCMNDMRNFVKCTQWSFFLNSLFAHTNCRNKALRGVHRTCMWVYYLWCTTEVTIWLWSNTSPYARQWYYQNWFHPHRWSWVIRPSFNNLYVHDTEIYAH